MGHLEIDLNCLGICRAWHYALFTLFDIHFPVRDHNIIELLQPNQNRNRSMVCFAFKPGISLSISIYLKRQMINMSLFRCRY